MILPLVVLAVLQAPNVVEVPDATEKDVTIQAVTRLPDLTPREQSVLRVLIRVIPLQTDDFIRRDMLAITDGRPVKMSVMPDHVRVSITVPAANMTTGLSLLEALYRRSSLRQEELSKGAWNGADYWGAALDRFLPKVDRLSRNEAWVLYRKLFRADRTVIAVGGNIEVGKAQESWSNRVASWKDERLPAVRTPFQDARTLTSGPGAVTMLGLVGKSVIADDVDLAGKLLAMIAVGSGKGSTLHRIWRDKNAWSYRQEAVLWPTSSGWQPRLMAAMKLSEDPKGRADAAKSAVLEDIDRWTEADRGRALGMAAAVLVNGVQFSPLYLTPDGPPSSDIQGRTFLAAYWPQKTGTPWRPDRLLASMGLIKLDELKATAKEIVSGMIPDILPGR